MRKLCYRYVGGLLAMGLILCAGTISAQELSSKKVYPVRSGVVNFKEAAALDAMKPANLSPRPSFIPNEEEDELQEEPYAPLSPAPTVSNVLRTAVTSPSAVLNFEGAPDGAQTGSGSWTIPPDTHGAVGLDKIFVQLNNNYRILNKTSGAQVSIVSIETFWSSLGTDGTSVFDPQVVYDPYNNRWIVAATSHGGAASSRVLLGISQTHDPSGNWNLYSFDPDAGTANWADYPMLGFNKNWIAIGVNMFPVTGSSAVPNLFYVIDYPSLRSSIVNSTVFSGTDFCQHPAETYSSTESNLYAPAHLSSSGATYRMLTVTGTPASPTASFSATKTRTGGGWTQPGGNTAPQNCITAPCPGKKLDVGDAQIRSNVIFRNNAIWYAQTIGLPAGATSATIDRAAAQWTKIGTDATFLDGGRVEDPTATATNGGRWYTYPSIAVNSNNDVLVGFTKTESDGFASAGYAFRYGTDAAGTMQDPVIYQDGVDYYDKDFGGSRNRWGDYSHTLVDPSEDASLWTLQEYAKQRAAPTVGGSDSKWGTWWAKVAPNACLSNVASGNWNTSGTWGCGSVPDATKHVNIMSGQNVTLDVNPLAASITVNSGGTLTINASRTLSCKLIVYGTLNITGGKLTLGNNDVFLAESATLTGGSTSGYFITNGTGSVSKSITGGSSFEFPVSPNASSYNSLTITTNAGDPTEVFSVRVATGVSPSNSLALYCVQRTWTISELTTGGNNAKLTFKWAAADQGSSFNPGQVPYAYRHNGSTWLMASAMTTPSLSSGIYSSQTNNAMSSFSPWVVSTSPVLPIDIEYFTGSKLSDGSHKLNWKATCSGANASFELQRSNDAQKFTALTTIRADYNRCLAPFDFTDLAPVNGKNFYRLKVTDENGKVSYSNLVLLLSGTSGFELVSVQPNPVKSSAILNYTTAKWENLKIIITSSNGSKVYESTLYALPGVNQEDLKVDNLQSGTYLITVISDQNESRTLRFVKQ